MPGNSQGTPTAATWQTFLQRWVRFLGPPSFVINDGGNECRGAFKRGLEQLGAFQHVTIPSRHGRIPSPSVAEDGSRSDYNGKWTRADALFSWTSSVVTAPRTGGSIKGATRLFSCSLERPLELVLSHLLMMPTPTTIPLAWTSVEQISGTGWRCATLLEGTQSSVSTKATAL